jgi:hypothetical protein
LAARNDTAVLRGLCQNPTFFDRRLVFPLARAYLCGHFLEKIKI